MLLVITLPNVGGIFFFLLNLSGIVIKFAELLAYASYRLFCRPTEIENFSLK